MGDKKLSPEQIQLSMNLYDQIIERKISLSEYLDEITEIPEGSNLDAFELQLKRLNICTKSIPGRRQADQVQAFFRTGESEVLFPEFISRQVRKLLRRIPCFPH